MQHSRKSGNGHHTSLTTFFCHLCFEDLTEVEWAEMASRGAGVPGERNSKKEVRRNPFISSWGSCLASEQLASSAAISWALFNSQPSEETFSPPHNQSVLNEHHPPTHKSPGCQRPWRVSILIVTLLKSINSIKRHSDLSLP